MRSLLLMIFGVNILISAFTLHCYWELLSIRMSAVHISDNVNKITTEIINRTKECGK